MHEQNSTGEYRQHRDEAYWTPTTTPTTDLEIVHTQPGHDPDFDLPPAASGRFRKGYDPRRHKFTRDECSAGFWAAIESIIMRYPDAIMPDGRHIACVFLRRRARDV